MVAVPAFVPVTAPVVGFTDTLPLGLLHTPPAGVLDKVTVDPLHTTNGVGPVIAVGSAYTVTATVLRQLVANV
jgi:hypothetical protein